ncbi:MAG: peroxiredoxin family protein [Myxococcota bacterium]
MTALDGLQERIADFETLDARIVAVSPDSVEQNRGVAGRLGLGFPILSDPDLALTKELGLLHAGGGPPPDFADIPRPAVFIVQDGTVRWRALTDNWRIRVRPDPLLEEVRRIVGS